MKLVFSLFSLGYHNPIALTVLGMAAVVLFTGLDQGLSGGSAQDPIYATMFLAAGVTALFLLGVNGFGQAGRVIGVLLGASPFLYVGGMIAINAVEGINANYKTQRNAECAVEAAGIPAEDADFVRMRLRQMKRHSFMAVDIEDRLKIKILPNCKFERVVPSPFLKPKQEAPPVIFGSR
ncbi:MAG: hypothetical protein AAGK17_10230 [Pseudomonadota bacterium]